MKKPLKVGAWSGIIALIVHLALFIFIIAFRNSPAVATSILFFGVIFGGMFLILFMNGFLALGRRFSNKILIIMSLIGIVILIVYMTIANLGNIAGYINYGAQELSEQLPTQISYIGEIDKQILYPFVFMLWMFLSGMLGVFSILFGVGLLEMKGKVRYSDITGILKIVSGITFVILVGFAVSIVSFIFEIIVLFNTSKKFEK